MKAFLMHADRDFVLHPRPASNENDLVQDLALDIICTSMARGDKFLFEVAHRALLSSLTDPKAIVYRQQILVDCLDHPELIREMYAIAVEALESERKIWRAYLKSVDSILRRGVEVVGVLIEGLKKLRSLADEHRSGFRSPGFARFFEMLQRELDDDYFSAMEYHLQEVKFRGGVLISAQLGEGNKGADYVLRKLPPQRRNRWFSRGKGTAPSFGFQIAGPDESGFRALGELRGKGINLVANALHQSADHITSFFAMLRTELAFYVGCLNLREALTERGETTCIPTPLPARQPMLSARGVFDVSLRLSMKGRVVANDLDADGKTLVMITGANQGGKSTFLRSLGSAFVMMQAGMFVPAQSFTASVSKRVFTHFKREEDATMEAGKLDEELGRMRQTADEISGGCVLLCNESFGSTNEREGSEIARQIIRALNEASVRVLFVTHLFDLAESLHEKRDQAALFLRAERDADGRRTFRLIEGAPLPTSFGEDSYRRIFDAAAEA